MGMCAVLYNKVFKLIDFLFSAYCLIGRLRSLFLLSFVFKILKHYTMTDFPGARDITIYTFQFHVNFTVEILQ